MTKNIITTVTYNPSPLKDHDWIACFEGEEDTGNIGFGSTKEEAIANLKQHYIDLELEIPQ